MTTPWLMARMTGLGGSDIAALMGESRWKGPYELWAEKLGHAPDKGLDEKEHIEWGNRLEGPIIEAYWERTERLPCYDVHKVSQDCIWEMKEHRGETKAIARSRKYPFLIATTDDLILEYKPFPWESHADMKLPGPGVLEVKTTNAYNKGDWDDGPPPYYEWQAQHYMLVTGLKWASFAVLVGGNELRIFDIPAKPMWQAHILERGQYFWHQNVLKEIPPTPSGLDSEGRIINAMFPEEERGKVIELPEEAAQLFQALDDLGKRHEAAHKVAAELDSRRKSIKNRLRLMMGDAEVGTMPDGRVALTYKTVRRKPYSVTPQPTRQLRIKRQR